VLERRLETERLRARGFAADAGVEWKDPTVWTDENGDEHPVRGPKIRVVLERVLIVDDRDPSLKGAGEIDLEVLVRTEDNGGIEQRTRLPAKGHSNLGAGERLKIDEQIFVGFVKDDLGIYPDDNLGSYTRTSRARRRRGSGVINLATSRSTRRTSATGKSPTGSSAPDV
jgi:hypothetical protein